MPNLCLHFPVELLFPGLHIYIYLPMCQKPSHAHVYAISEWIPADYPHITLWLKRHTVQKWTDAIIKDPCKNKC